MVSSLLLVWSSWNDEICQFSCLLFNRMTVLIEMIGIMLKHERESQRFRVSHLVTPQLSWMNRRSLSWLLFWDFPMRIFTALPALSVAVSNYTKNIWRNWVGSTSAKYQTLSREYMRYGNMSATWWWRWKENVSTCRRCCWPSSGSISFSYRHNKFSESFGTWVTTRPSKTRCDLSYHLDFHFQFVGCYKWGQ